MPHAPQAFRMRRPLIEVEGCIGPKALTETMRGFGQHTFDPAPFLGFSVLSRSTMEAARRATRSEFRDESDEAVFGKIYTRLPRRKTQNIQATATGLALIRNNFVAVRLSSEDLRQDRLDAGRSLAKLAQTNAVGDRNEGDISMVIGEFTTSLAHERAPVALQLAATLTGQELWFGPIPKKLV